MKTGAMLSQAKKLPEARSEVWNRSFSTMSEGNTACRYLDFRLLASRTVVSVFCLFCSVCGFSFGKICKFIQSRYSWLRSHPRPPGNSLGPGLAILRVAVLQVQGVLTSCAGASVFTQRSPTT